MGHTRLKKKKIRRATKKKWRGGATITKTKAVQQSFDTIHDFYRMERGLFKVGIESNDPNKAKLYMTMKSIMQYMIITLNSIIFDIPISHDIHTSRIDDNTQLSKYVGNKKEGQLFFAVPNSEVTTSGIEKTGVAYFEIPEGREWTYSLTGPNAESSFINLVNVLFNINNDPDDDIKHAYNLALGLDKNTAIPAGATLTNRHRIYMVCDAGANTYGTLAASVRPNDPAKPAQPAKLAQGGKPAQPAKPAGKLFNKTYSVLTGPPLTELALQCTTADSASSNPYEDHEFVFVETPGTPNVFISDANLYTSDIYEIRYERDKWHPATGLGFKLVISRKVPAGSPKTDLFSLEYGVRGSNQSVFVPLPGSRAAPAVYNSQGPSAALMTGCALLRALAYPDIADEKIGKQPIVDPLTSRSPRRVRDMVALPLLAGLPALPGLPPPTTLREQIVHELIRIMTASNGFSPLSDAAKVVDPYSFLGTQFGNFPPELWFDIKRGGDRDQVKALHILSQQKKDGNLVYPFIHFVTGDFLAAKMAVELGLAVIYQGGGVIRYWPKMFRFREQSKDTYTGPGRVFPPFAIQPDGSGHYPEANANQWRIELWGGKQMKGGLRNPTSKDIGREPYTHVMPAYTYIEDNDGVRYTFDAQGNFVNVGGQTVVPGRHGIPHIIMYDAWLNPSKYVMMKQTKQLVVTPQEIIEKIYFIYQAIGRAVPQIPHIPEIPDEKMEAPVLTALLQGIEERLSYIDSRPPPNSPPLSPAIKEAIINVLQGISILKGNNTGIYQYDFINHVMFGNDPKINELDELTFRAVNNSKEDDGLAGAALIGENSPEVIVTPANGQPQWIIPALLNTDLLKYDINFMVDRFLISLVLYFNDTSFTRDEIIAFMDVQKDLEVMNREPDNDFLFMKNYGINPIVSYIRVKYTGFDLDGLENAVKIRITERIEAAIRFHVPRATGAFKRKTPIKVKTQTAFTPSLGLVGPVAAASSVSTPISFGQSTFSSNPTPPAASFRPPPPPASNRIRIPSQSSSSAQSAFGQSPFASFARPSSSSQQSAWGSPFSTSLSPTPSAAFAQSSSSSFGQAAAPLTRNANNSPRKAPVRTLKKGVNAEQAREDRIELQEYLRKKQRQATVNRRRGLISGGRRRTQKNHKRKKYGTQRKRSH